jgi:uncharacterized Zn finger protein
MATIPPITEQDIGNLVGAASFQRGQQYFRNGHISHTRRQDMTLKARCEGSRPEPYRVEVTFADEGIASTGCSCPIGGYCKHVVALLFTWLADPKEFSEVEDINAALERRSKEELITLIKRMLRKDPDLEDLLDLPQPRQQAPVTPEAYRRLVEKAFREGDDEWGAEADIAYDLLAVKEMGDEFAQQHDYSSAVLIYNKVVTGTLAHFYDYENEGGELEGVVTECVTALGECLEHVQDDNALREKILRAIFEVYRFDMQAGGIGLSDDVPDLLLEKTTAEEHKVVAGWVREQLRQPPHAGLDEYAREWYGGFLLELEAEALDDESFLRIARETGRIHDVVNRLLALGRVDEAVKDAEQASDYDLLEIANIFVRHGHDAIAQRLIAERSKRSTDTRLLEWLKKHYLTHNELAAALKVAEELFYKEYPNIAAYQEIRQIATQLGRWQTIHPRLLKFLEKAQNTQMLIKIALDEDDIDKALALIKVQQKSAYGYNTLPIEVARAAEKTRPRAAIEIYQQYAEHLIDQRGRENYQLAASYLSRVRQLYQNLGERGTWANYITTLRDRNRNLRALKEELAKAGL